MVADDEVLQQRLEFDGKVWDQREYRLQHLKFNDHVPEKLAARGVGKRAIVGKLVNLADVVKKYASQQQIAIHLRIVSAHQVARTKKRDYVVKQAADIGVMQGLGSRSIAVRCRDLRVGHEGLHQSLEMSVLKRRNEVRQRLPEVINIPGGLGKIVREVDFGFAQLAQLVDGELKTVSVLVDQAFDLEEVVLLEGIEHFFHVVPHLGFELPAAVAESKSEIRLTGFLGLDLFADHDKVGSDDLVFVAGAIADVELFHSLHQCKSESMRTARS